MRDPKKEFVRIFRRIAPNHDRYEVWRDFLEMAYCAIKKQTLPPGADADALEARYMTVVSRHDKEDIRKSPSFSALRRLHYQQMKQEISSANCTVSLSLGTGIEASFSHRIICRA